MKTIHKQILIALLFSFFVGIEAFAQMPQDGSKVVVSNFNFSDTVQLLTDAIAEENLMVVNEMDGQRMLRMVGKQVGGMKQIFFFHPQYMAKVIEANQQAAIQIPLKFIIMERPDGKAMIRYFPPSTLFKGYEGTEEVGKELDEIVEKIVSSLN